MSCYFRRLEGILAEAGILVTPAEQEIDRPRHA
jgi:hypothetical protein